MVETLHTIRPESRVVVLTGFGNIATAVAAVKYGAIDYLPVPVVERDGEHEGREQDPAPELRYTPTGTAVVDMRLAVNRNYTTQGGEKREDTCFLTVVVWGKQAETCGEYLDKGSPVLVEGRLQTRDWETKDGQKRNVVEVVAERVQFMGRGRTAGAPAASSARVISAAPHSMSLFHWVAG